MFFWFCLDYCVGCFCRVRFSFFSTKSRDRLGRTSLKWPILCQVGHETLTQSAIQLADSAGWCKSQKRYHYKVHVTFLNAGCLSKFFRLETNSSAKFIIISLLKMPPHIKHVSMLSCEIFEIFLTQSCYSHRSFFNLPVFTQSDILVYWNQWWTTVFGYLPLAN